MENPAAIHPDLGPWDGIDETGALGPTKIRDGLNVVFRGGRISRRPGRAVVATDASGRRVAGLHEHVAPSGARSVLAYLDPFGAVAGGLGTVSWRTGAVANVAMPPEAASVEPELSTAAVPMDGHTIIAEPGGLLLDYDGVDLSVLEAMAGEDAGVQNEAYLGAPPRASRLAIWRDRVVAAGAPDSPRLIGLSENKWAVDNIPVEAPIGGANVWPSRTNFDLSNDEGDSVEAVSVIHDRLAVLGRSGIAMVDEDSVAPYARGVARQHGCIAPRSVVNVGNALIYLSEKNVLIFDGIQSVVPVSNALRRTMDELVDWDSAHLAVAVHLRQTTEYRLWVPVKGLPGNQLCLIYDYMAKTWTKASHWYLFDSADRRDLPYRFDVTAALAVILGSGREVLLTGDSAGRIWLEDVGEDDEGQIFPAFAAFGEMDRGSEWETYSDWHVDCLHDGSYIAALCLTGGRDVEQEIVRVLNGALTGAATDDIPYVLQRALLDGQRAWDEAARAWPIDARGPRVTRLDLGLRAKERKVQPVLLLPGQSGASVDPAPGAIRRLGLGVRARGGRRS